MTVVFLNGWGIIRKDMFLGPHTRVVADVHWRQTHALPLSAICGHPWIAEVVRVRRHLRQARPTVEAVGAKGGGPRLPAPLQSLRLFISQEIEKTLAVFLMSKTTSTPWRRCGFKSFL